MIQTLFGPELLSAVGILSTAAAPSMTLMGMELLWLG
jgi:hypothetical protein